MFLDVNFGTSLIVGALFEYKSFIEQEKGIDLILGGITNSPAAKKEDFEKLEFERLIRRRER